MSRVDDPPQVPLPLPSRPTEIDLATIARQPSMSAAIALCVSLGGFENDKDFCRTFSIDPATWARIKGGDAHFPQDRLEEFFHACGNEVPLFWLADRLGYELRKKQTEVEKALAAEQAKREEVERENALLKKLLVGRAV